MSNNYLSEYRKHLLEIYQKSQEDYDKTVLTLSSSALGISFAFVKDIIGAEPIINVDLLFWSWLCWGISVTFVLVSHLSSSFSIRETIRQVDSEDVYSSRVGGWYDIVTSVLNPTSGILFVVGLILLVLFVKRNMV